MSEGTAQLGLVALGAILGGVLVVAVEWARGAFLRRQQRQDRREDFQRATLIALQEAVAEDHRAAARLYFRAQKWLEEKGSWPTEEVAYIDEATMEHGRAAGIRQRLLASRVQDERLRTLEREYRATTRALAHVGSVEAAKVADAAMAEAANRVLDRAGELIRDL